MGKKVSLWVFALAVSILWAVPMFAQDDEVVRNPDGMVGSAVVDVAAGWTRNTAYWRNALRDDNDFIFEGKQLWPLSSRVTLALEWDHLQQLQESQNSFMAGFNYFSRAIGSGVAMSPDGAVGSIVLHLNAGYHRLAGAHGARVDAGLLWPIKPMLSWTLDGTFNTVNLDEQYVDRLNDYTVTSGFNIYSAILTYDDPSANPDGVIGSLGLKLWGGFRHRDDDNGGVFGGTLQIPMATWLTPYISYSFQKLDDVFTDGPEVVDPAAVVPVLVHHERNSLVNQIRIGLKIY